jgi:uncharacterized C2H2 Zn-finger protein
MLKFLIDVAIIALIAYFIYTKFFKKETVKEGDPNEMIECDCCGIFIERKDMLNQHNKHYCSDVCAKKGVSK